MSFSNYLISTLTKVGSTVTGSGRTGIPDFHYLLGEHFASHSIWQLHLSTHTNKQEEATVFVFDKRQQGASYLVAAQNTLKRMRTLRHPGLLRYLEGAETPDAIYIATEAVTPLTMSPQNDDEMYRWGLYKVADTLRFLNQDCHLVHANVSASSVFVTRAGEWKLGGMELADSLVGGQQPCMYRTYTGVIPGYKARMPPEFAAQKWDAIEKHSPGAVDGWGLGCLISECFNQDSASKSMGQIPKSLWLWYQRLSAPDIRRRSTPQEFLENNRYLDSPFVRACVFLESMAVKDERERTAFLAGLETVIGEFPQAFCKFKILPELLKLMEFGGGDAKVLGGIIQIGKGLDESEYNSLVTPAIVQLFGSNDRALRFSLLERLTAFIHAIPAQVVSKQVFPNFATGFLDAQSPAIREATVKASLAVAPKLSQKALNNDLIRQLVRLVADPEPGIRTNTLICIGKLCTAKPSGPHPLDGDGVTESSHRYIVCPSLLQALRDPFPPVRSAALAVASGCASRWDPVEIARRIVPNVAPLLVDGEKPVRAAATKAINVMVARAEAHAQTMPDTLAKPKASSGTQVGQQQQQAAAQAAASMAVSDSWGGWAVSSLSSTINGAISLASSSMPATPADQPNESQQPRSSSQQQQQQQQAADKKLEETGGWEFNDQGWDDEKGWGGDSDDDDENEAWDLNETPMPAMDTLSITKPEVRPPGSNTSTQVEKNKRGLGAMKLGSSSNKGAKNTIKVPDNLDDFF